MITFIVLNYMDYFETMETVKEILNLDGVKNIVIVDNGSPNDSYRKLQEFSCDYKMITVLKIHKNLGFAKGNNVGYRYAVKKLCSKFVVVLNSDIRIDQKDLIYRISRSYRKYSFDIMGPDIVTISNEKHQNPLDWDMPSIKQLQRKINILNVKILLRPMYWIRWNLFGFINKKRKIQNVYSHRIESSRINVPLHGSFYVFSPAFIELNQEACFYEKTFMYMEAQILYWQAQKKHYTLVYDPEIVVHHVDDASTDMTFTNRYKKAMFSNKALLQSTKVFIELMRGE